MAWQEKSDLGLQTVAHIHDMMRIDDQWVTQQDRGYTWWPSDFSQKIWSDPGIFQYSESIYRIHVETDFLMGHGKCGDLALGLVGAIEHETLSGVVYSESDDTYRLCCSVLVNEENQPAICHTLLSAVCLQIVEANAQAKSMATQLNAVQALSEHPQKGPRRQPDPMMSAVDRFFKPAGANTSRWIDSPEWEGLYFHIERITNALESDRKSFLRAEFPIPDPTYPNFKPMMSMEASATDEHPDLGHGLHICLKLPQIHDPHEGTQIALKLNELERAEWRRSQFLGSWGMEAGKLEFTSFVPNTAYHSDTLRHLVMSMLIRAEWVQDHFAQRAYPFFAS